MNIRPNRVKQKLAAGQVATIVAGTNEPDLIDQLGTLDVDGIWLEGEHGAVDFGELGNLTRACDLWGKTSVVRVMDNDYATIYRTLDRGAQGIVVPHVNTRAEADAVVAAGKFAPLGKRGMYTSRQGFGVDGYLKTANDQSLLIVLIEDIVAVRASTRSSRSTRSTASSWRRVTWRPRWGRSATWGTPTSSRRSTVRSRRSSSPAVWPAPWSTSATSSATRGWACASS